ncbi:hypothetical protein GCM10007424_03360 [Flavobacterium suaedae]|uniref:DUF7683 domain-containing protein n=1 Tax=Flavobacterium suaedae TaxID=1767027 RepID=A0ABQ1JH57_9FLAO|nr:hypothetical protein [Flavobacterium suaedae]GGB66721.1 hypothetical protein GCM10007424_03360 [Flavobacterium suaedae]
MASRSDIISVNTYIEVFNISNDEYIEEFDISHIPLAILRTIFDPNEEYDVELYLSYSINKEKSIALNSFIDPPIIFEFSKYEYFLQRYGDYK